MKPIPVKVTTLKYTIPDQDYSSLKLIFPDRKEHAEKGMIKEIDIPAGGVEIQFLTGGGKHAQTPLFVTTSHEQPKAQPKAEPTTRKSKKSMPKSVSKEGGESGSDNKLHFGDSGRASLQKPDDMQSLEQSKKDHG